MNPLQLAKDLLYPRLCSACQKTLNNYEKFICVSCHISLPKIRAYQYQEKWIDKKLWGKLKVKNTYSFLQFAKNGPVQQILHELKYKNKPELAEFMGKWFANDLLTIGFDKEIDLIIGIPLHPIKTKRRGYNQADCFAKGLSKKLKVPQDSQNLRRKKFTDTQTNKSRFSRYANLTGAFGLMEPTKIKGKRIALVDDVLTTGATLEVAGALLLEAGCAELFILTIAAAQ